ncbi:unnamed protein product, partial [Mesorhabditis spiculigera]
MEHQLHFPLDEEAIRAARASWQYKGSRYQRRSRAESGKRTARCGAEREANVRGNKSSQSRSRSAAGSSTSTDSSSTQRKKVKLPLPPLPPAEPHVCARLKVYDVVANVKMTVAVRYVGAAAVPQKHACLRLA